MTVLICANNDVGIYQFRQELINALLSAGNRVVISLPYGPLVDRLVESGCEFIDTPLSRRSVNPVTDLQLLRKYASILSAVEPDLVIAYTIKPNIYCGLACRAKQIPFFANITGLGTAFENDGLLKKLVVFLYKWSLKTAKGVFFENADNKRIFLDGGIIREAQAYLLNGAGVNLEKYSFQAYPNNKTIQFLFIGRVMKEKGVNELLEAMNRLISEGVDCSLDIVGPYEEDYTALFEDGKSQGWLNYHGYQEDVKPYIMRCDCFVLPSYHEGMANTNLECAASGRPVITSSIPGCMEAVEDGVSGFLCEARSPYSLYEVMKKFTELSYEDRCKMGLNGRKRMELLFDKKKVVAQTIRIILADNGSL